MYIYKAKTHALNKMFITGNRLDVFTCIVWAGITQSV